MVEVGKETYFLRFLHPPRLWTFSAYVLPFRAIGDQGTRSSSFKFIKTQICWLILWDKTSSSLSVWKTYLLPTIMRNENLHHLKVEDMAWILKSKKPCSTPKWKICHFTTYHKGIVVHITTRIDKSLIFWENLKVKSQSGEMVWMRLIDF